MKFRPLGHFLIIAIIGILAYSNTFRSPFQWDEAEYILRNPVITNLLYFMEPSRAETLLDNALISRYIGYLTFALNYRLHGFNVTGYHVVNLAIHIANAVLVYFLVLLTLRTPYFEGPGSRVQGPGGGHSSLITHNASRFSPLAVALLFVAHPVQTEAVTYVFQRFASLVSMFYLLSLVLYIKGRQSAISDQQSDGSPLKKGARGLSFLYYFLSFLCAVLAMKTKENAFTLPVIITLYEFLFFTGPLKSRVLRLAPFLFTMLIIPATLAGLSNTAAEVISQVKDPLAVGYEKISRESYFFTQLRVIVTYLRLLFLPVNQNIDYTYPLYHSLFELPVLLSFAFLSSLLGSAVYMLVKAQKCGSQESGVRSQKSGEESMQYAYYRLAAFGIFWFFITLSVESSIIPIPMVINEYRVYLPSAGFFLALASAVLLLFHRLPGASPQRQKAAVVVFGTIILALATATYARNSLWSGKVSLWEDVVRKSPGSPRGYNNLGIAYHEKGLEREAIDMYLRGIAIAPYFRDAYVNLGISYAGAGRLDMAVDTLHKAIEIDPQNSTAHANLARAYSDAGRYDLAVDYYLRAIDLNSYDSKVYHGLGFACVKLGRLDDALAAFTKFVELSPDNPEAYRNRGNVYAYRGDFRNAGADFRKACSMGNMQSCEYLKRSPFSEAGQ